MVGFLLRVPLSPWCKN